MAVRKQIARTTINNRMIDGRHFHFDSFNSDGDFCVSSAIAAAKRWVKHNPNNNNGKLETYNISKIDGHYQIVDAK